MREPTTGALPERRAKQILLVMVVVAAAVRFNNVLTFPALRAFDGFGHFSYIWFMADQWRVPLATSGWSFFHPPLYYALMASIWTALAPLDAVARLGVGVGIIAMLGLVHGLGAYAIGRRAFPGRPVVALLGAGLMFFLPVHLYSSGFLGNEGLNSVLCSATMLTLLWVLRDASWRRGVLLGLVLGLAMLTKFTSVAIVAGAFASLSLHTLFRLDWRRGLATITSVAVVMLMVCGWYYARNISVYGTPFKLSRDEFMVRHVENYQSQGRRNFWEYVLFDPVILRRPMWPRGITMTGDFTKFTDHSALRESVPTGVYANAWFDGGQGIALPPITNSEESRRAGQIILTLALVPSILVLVGLGTGMYRLARARWDDVIGPMLMAFVPMVALFVQATSTVPMHAAVKATYLTPVSMIFGFWFMLGADVVRAARPRWFRWIVVSCGMLAVACVVTFTSGRFLARGWLDTASTRAAPWQNLYGIVYYAAGDVDHARSLFEQSAQNGWFLAEENLGFLTLRDGKPLEALYHVRTAARRQPYFSFGTREDRAHFDRINQADYQNQMAVIYFGMGDLDLALTAAQKAYELDGSVPEIQYDLAVVKLARGLEHSEGDAALARAIAQSRALVFRAAGQDPAFFEAAALSGVLDALEGNCERGVPTMHAALAPHPHQYRIYPTTTGPGNFHAASLRRRTFITNLPAALRADDVLARCAVRADRG